MEILRISSLPAKHSILTKWICFDFFNSIALKGGGKESREPDPISVRQSKLKINKEKKHV